MQRILTRAFLACLLFVSTSWSSQAQDPIAAALQDCSVEMENYCSSVTPGEGRLILCAKAHADKLSGVCVQAINRATYWTDSLAMTLDYVALQCGLDATTHCADVEPGDFRILSCLESKKPSLSKYCALAVEDASR